MLLISSGCPTTTYLLLFFLIGYDRNIFLANKEKNLLDRPIIVFSSNKNIGILCITPYINNGILTKPPVDNIASKLSIFIFLSCIYTINAV